MPRKSRQLRLTQATALLSLYDKINVDNRSHAFIRDMVARLEIRDISSGQKRYLDNLIEQGAPSVKNENPERVAVLREIFELEGMTHRHEVINSFSRSLRNGWQLSERQEDFIKIIEKEAADIRSNGVFRPSQESIIDLQAAVDVAYSKNSWYWAHRVGTNKAFLQVAEWLTWNIRMRILNSSIENNIGEEKELKLSLESEPKIDKWACDKLLKAFKNPVNELKNPRHLIGEFRWTRTDKTALIIDVPTLRDGRVVYSCLVDGSETEFQSGDLLKRKS